MGTLAKTLGKSITVDVKGCKVSVSQLSLDALFDCIREGFTRFSNPPERIDEAAEKAIETGRIPLTALSVIVSRSCKDLDEEDVATIMGADNMKYAYEIAAASMGYESSNDGTAKTASKDNGKKK